MLVWMVSPPPQPKSSQKPPISLSPHKMLSVKASYMVKPAGQTPETIMYISEMDQIGALTHISTVYFYRAPAHSLSLNPAEILKDSLSKALVIFYPLAGRLQWIARGRLELHCNSMGALFVEAESESKINDFGDFCPTPEIRALIPSVDYNRPIHEQPLVLVQVTKFSCGGICVGVGLSHVLIDGQSSALFASEWARIARGEQPLNLPFLDRTILQPKEELSTPNFDHLEFSPPPLLIGKSNNFEERKKETTVTMLKLSKEQVESLRKKANESPKDVSRPFSRYEAVAAHIWRCTSRARDHQSEQLTRLRVPLDFRNRMDPPLPKCYFGNAILTLTPTVTSGELLSKPMGFAAQKIREEIEKVTDEYVKSALVYLKYEPDMSRLPYHHVVGSTKGAFHGNPTMSITSWMTGPLYGADFGLGKEIYMGPAVLGHDGKAYILPGRDENGSLDGSLAIPFRLQVAHMDAFKKFFYQDL